VQKQEQNSKDKSVKADMFMGGNTSHLPWAARLTDER